MSAIGAKAECLLAGSASVEPYRRSRRLADACHTVRLPKRMSGSRIDDANDLICEEQVDFPTFDPRRDICGDVLKIVTQVAAQAISKTESVLPAESMTIVSCLSRFRSRGTIMRQCSGEGGMLAT